MTYYPWQYPNGGNGSGDIPTLEPDSLNAGYENVNIAHTFAHQDDVQLYRDGVEQQPLRYNPATGQHNATIFQPEDTVSDLLVVDGANAYSINGVQTKAFPTSPSRSNTISINNSAEVNALDGQTITDTLILFPPDRLLDVGNIVGNNWSGVTLRCDTGVCILDGSVGESINNTWTNIGDDIWRNESPIVNNETVLLVFGGSVLQNVSFIANDDQDVLDITSLPQAFWATNPDRDIWWVRLPGGADPNAVEQTISNREHAIQLNGVADIWIENIKVQYYGTSSSANNSSSEAFFIVDSDDIHFRGVSSLDCQSPAFDLTRTNNVTFDGVDMNTTLLPTVNRRYFKFNSGDWMGVEQMSSIRTSDCDNVAIRNVTGDAVGDAFSIFGSTNVEIRDFYFKHALEEMVSFVFGCQFCWAWNGRIEEYYGSGPIDPNPSIGPVGYINIGVIGTKTWYPADEFAPFLPTNSLSEFAGWNNEVLKYNVGNLPEIGLNYIFHCTGANLVSLIDRDLWDARTVALDLGSTSTTGSSVQTHLRTVLRNNIWFGPGRGVQAPPVPGWIDADFDQVTGLLTQEFDESQNNLDLPLHFAGNSTHQTTEQMLEVMPDTFFPNGMSEDNAFAGVFDVATGVTVPLETIINAVSRQPGEFLPGITGNPLFTQSLPQQNGAFV